MAKKIILLRPKGKKEVHCVFKIIEEKKPRRMTRMSFIGRLKKTQQDNISEVQNHTGRQD
jgi:hypothetical protein